jgi:hypothetical protein
VVFLDELKVKGCGCANWLWKKQSLAFTGSCGELLLISGFSGMFGPSALVFIVSFPMRLCVDLSR